MVRNKRILVLFTVLSTDRSIDMLEIVLIVLIVLLIIGVDFQL